MIRVYFFEMAILYCYMLDPAVDQTSLDLPTTHRLILNISIWNLNKWNILSHSWGPQNVLAMLDRSDMTGRSNWKSRCCTCHFSCELACGRFWATVLTCFDLGLCFLFFLRVGWSSKSMPDICPFQVWGKPCRGAIPWQGFLIFMVWVWSKNEDHSFFGIYHVTISGQSFFGLVQSQQPVGYVQFFSYLKDCRSCS